MAIELSLDFLAGYRNKTPNIGNSIHLLQKNKPYLDSYFIM
jgi:hypothetical protein